MTKRTIFITVIILGVLIGVSGIAYAQENGFAVPWWTVDGGGDFSIGGDYRLGGTTGQPDAGMDMTGGDFHLAGGFWALMLRGSESITEGLEIYLPIVQR